MIGMLKFHSSMSDEDKINAINHNFDDIQINHNHLEANILLQVYPVGSIYMSVNSTNPGTLFGGTWEAWGSGRVPVGIDTTQTEFDAVEKTGGAKTHTLTVNEMPSHRHSIYPYNDDWNNSPGGQPYGTTYDGSSTKKTNSTYFTENTGDGAAHNNLQPFITCYIWKRTA